MTLAAVPDVADPGESEIPSDATTPPSVTLMRLVCAYTIVAVKARAESAAPPLVADVVMRKGSFVPAVAAKLIVHVRVPFAAVVQFGEPLAMDAVVGGVPLGGVIVTNWLAAETYCGRRDDDAAGALWGMTTESVPVAVGAAADVGVESSGIDAVDVVEPPPLHALSATTANAATVENPHRIRISRKPNRNEMKSAMGKNPSR